MTFWSELPLQSGWGINDITTDFLIPYQRKFNFNQPYNIKSWIKEAKEFLLFICSERSSKDVDGLTLAFFDPCF